MITLAPLLSGLALYLTIAALIILAIIQLAQTRGKQWARSIVAVVLGLLILNPVLQNDRTEILPNTLIVVDDRSDSQFLANREGQSDRALTKIRKQVQNLQNITLQVLKVSNAQSEDNPGTHILAPLKQAIQEIPAGRLAGVIVVSDGQIHDSIESLEQALIPAPLHALVTGTDKETDRRLTLISAPRFGIVGEPQTLQFRLDEDGPGTPEETQRIIIKRDGQVINETIAQVGVPTDITVRIPHRGQSLFELSVTKLDNELTDVNNRLIIPIEGIRENLRVLLVSGTPHPGERTWRNLLKSDAAVDLVHFTILRPPEKQDGTPVNQLSLIAFPTRELFSEKIDQFDLIILDRYKRRGVLPVRYFENIANYVRKGGAVLVAAGPEYAEFGSLNETVLSDIIPVRPSGGVIETPFKARTTPTGLRHPVSKNLPGNGEQPDWSPWFRVVDSDPTGGDVIMKGADERPLLILNRVEEGRIAVLLSDHVWLWQRGFQGGGPYLPLLRRIAHWLMKEPDLEEERLTARQSGKALVVTRQSLKETLPALTLGYPGGKTTNHALTQTTPGQWTTIIPNLNPGLYTLNNGKLTTSVVMGLDGTREFENPVSTLDYLQRLSQKSGGSTQRLLQNGGENTPNISLISEGRRTYVGSGWIGIIKPSKTRTLDIVRHALIPAWLGVLLAIGALAWAWRREGT